MWKTLNILSIIDNWIFKTTIIVPFLYFRKVSRQIIIFQKVRHLYIRKSELFIIPCISNWMLDMRSPSSMAYFPFFKAIKARYFSFLRIFSKSSIPTGNFNHCSIKASHSAIAFIHKHSIADYPGKYNFILHAWFVTCLSLNDLFPIINF